MTAVSATFWTSLRDPHGKRFATTWAKLVERLSVPRISADKHDVPGLSLATFHGDKRALANVDRVFAVGIDLDELTTLSGLRERFEKTTSFVHTTWSSTMAAPRCRAFLLLSRPVTGDEYRRVYQAVAGKIEDGGFVVDRAASDPSRFWFLPSIAEEGRPFVYWSDEGAPVDVEAALAAVPPPEPPLPPSPRPLTNGGPSAFDRARKYLAATPGAISGSGGHGHTFLVASKVVRGFDLSVDDAIALMLEWNGKCSPPWSERDIRRKCEQAATVGRMNAGDMLERDRR